MGKQKNYASLLVMLMIICFVVAGYFAGKGYYKMHKYYNSDYSSQNVNAYVGGDAYNYIINGNYATGYYVLSMGFFIGGVLSGGFAAVISAIPKENNPADRKVDLHDELPDL